VKRNPFIALATLILALPGLLLSGACSVATPKVEAKEVKAAIIDQLYGLQPNGTFIVQITQYLEDYGCRVDLYQGDDITVDLYRKLPAHEYKLIIFRVHSGLLGADPEVTNKTWLFTAESYSSSRYISEQLTDQVTYAKTRDDTPWIFAISAKFVTDSMEGSFSDTAIMMMGCDGLHFQDMAQAFIEKGASTYIGWDASVGLNYVDYATPTLIELLCSKELSIAEAVAGTMEEKGSDPTHGSILKYYPPASASKTLKQLLE
jgi:hypothetical protein